MILEMSDQLRAEFDALKGYATLLEVRWRDYETLFGTDQARVDILNKTAPQFFALVEDSMWSSVVLDLTKMTADLKTGRHDNLTLQRLPALVDSSIRADVTAKVDAAVKACEFAKVPRNKVLAHWDLETLKNAFLDSGSRVQVNMALDAVGAAIESVLKPYAWFDWRKHPDQRGTGFALDLLRVLEKGSQG